MSRVRTGWPDPIAMPAVIFLAILATPFLWIERVLLGIAWKIGTGEWPSAHYPITPVNPEADGRVLDQMLERLHGEMADNFRRQLDALPTASEAAEPGSGAAR